jgi:hypothetical protein
LLAGVSSQPIMKSCAMFPVTGTITEIIQQRGGRDAQN